MKFRNLYQPTDTRGGKITIWITRKINMRSTHSSWDIRIQSLNRFMSCEGTKRSMSKANIYSILGWFMGCLSWLMPIKTGSTANKCNWRKRIVIGSDTGTFAPYTKLLGWVCTVLLFISPIRPRISFSTIFTHSSYSVHSFVLRL